MKRFFYLCLLSSALIAEEPEAEKSAEKPSFSIRDFNVLHTGGNAISIANANVMGVPEEGNFSFNKENFFLYMLLPISEKSYFFPRIEWNTFSFDWDKNPKFSQTRYYYTQFALTFYSTAMEKWRWILRADYNFDVEHFNNPGQYGLFSGLIWGAYEIHRKWHYHVGAFGYSGMKGEEVYPVIGADYSPNSTWTFLAVFPIDYSVQYKLDKEWRFSLKSRPLKERFRTGNKSLQPKSIFSYSSVGAELNVHYEKFMRIECEAYVGYNFGGSFYIKDAKGHNPLYADVGGAPYAGLNIDYAF